MVEWSRPPKNPPMSVVHHGMPLKPMFSPARTCCCKSSHVEWMSPDQIAALRADPSLLPNAAVEMIRWTTPVRHFLRTAVEDNYGELLDSWTAAHPIPVVPRKKLHTPRCLLVGDAAGLASPMSGEGMTNAL